MNARLLGAVRVSAQERAPDEQGPREVPQRYRAIFEAVADGVIISDLAGGRIEEVNPGAVPMRGRHATTGPSSPKTGAGTAGRPDCALALLTRPDHRSTGADPVDVSPAMAHMCPGVASSARRLVLVAGKDVGELADQVLKSCRRLVGACCRSPGEGLRSDGRAGADDNYGYVRGDSALHQMEGGCQIAAVEVAHDGFRVPELSLAGVVGVGADDLGSCGSVAGQVGDEGPSDPVVVTDDSDSRRAAAHVPIEHLRDASGHGRCVSTVYVI